MYSLLTELERKLILFFYEKRATKKLFIPCDLFNSEDQSFILTEGEYILWELEKRKLIETEIIGHSWLIASKDRYTLLLRFDSDSCLTISSLFDKELFHGRWFLENGILKIYFKYQKKDYAIDVIANNNCLIHSALQIIDDSSLDILKVIPISHAKYGHALVD